MTEEVKDALVLALGRLEGKMDMVLSALKGDQDRICKIEDRLGGVERKVYAVAALLGLIGAYLKDALIKLIGG